MLKRVLTIAGFALLCTPSFARADQLQVFLGSAAFTGVHKDRASDVRNAYVVALPSYALRGTKKRFEALFEDVPPITLRFPHAVYGVRSLSVGYGDAVVRYWLGRGRFAVGIGDSLYVRRNDYGSGSYNGVRSAGARYELLGAFPFAQGRRLLARLAVSPNMHQRFMEWATGARPFYQFGKASLIDGSLQFEEQRGGGHTWVWGIRYLNYAGGNFGPYWDNAQERTGIVTGFAAWGFTVGGTR